MNENAIVANVIAILTTGFASRAISVGIKQNYQPTTQGTPSTPYVYLHKISDAEYGFPGRSDAYNSDTSVIDHTEQQLMEITFQVSATAIQDPANTTQLTAGDYVKAAARILGSDVSTVAFQALGLGMLRIQKMRNSYFVDEKGQNEASPSFDFTLSYATTETTTQTGTTLPLDGNVFVANP